jgi:quinol monooxygenase YgiN
MLIVAGTFTVAPADRDAFIEQCADTMRRSRSEKGCREYVISPDPLDADTIRVFECWESQEDLDAHIAVLLAARAESSSTSSIAPLGRALFVYPIAHEGPRSL